MGDLIQRDFPKLRWSTGGVLSALNMRSDWFFLVLITFSTDGSLKSADKDLRESRAVTEKPRNTAVKFIYTGHRTILPL